MSDSAASPILPFYAVVDVSWSMTMKTSDGSTGIDAANKIAPEVVEAIVGAPTAADIVRFGMIDFSGEAEVVLPLMDPRQITPGSLPTLEARTTGTSYMSAFLTLRQQLEADVAQLKANNFKVMRPAVFFLTDGEPTDAAKDWQDAFAALTDPSFRARPNVVPFGILDAKKDILDQIASHKGQQKSFLSKDESAGQAIAKMIELLVGSIIESANSVATGGTAAGGFVPPSIDDEDEEDDWI